MQIAQPPLSQQPFLTTTTTKDNTRTTISIILATVFFSLLFIFSLSTPSLSISTVHTRPNPYLFPTRQPTFTKIPYDPAPPSIAYLISRSKVNSNRILRLLYVTYHPKNQYLLHLDLSAPLSDSDRLALTVQKVPIFRAGQKVNVMGKADFVSPKGSSMISATPHGAAILLRLSKNWDWFISLDVADYPLVTQDGRLFSLFLSVGGIVCGLVILRLGVGKVVVPWRIWVGFGRFRGAGPHLEEEEVVVVVVMTLCVEGGGRW